MTGRSFEETFGHAFAKPALLREALTHASLAARDRTGLALSNQRLEFLGDRVLGLVVAELLCERFPAEDEGALARRHAALVQRDALARVAERIDLGKHIVMSRGEEESGGRRNPSLLADTCEAVIAALYLDGGLEPARRFIRHHWEPLVDEDLNPPKDPKTALQEWAQGRGMPLPVYREASRKGPDHSPVFVVEVTLDGTAPVSGTGTSKRVAERAAAEAMLRRLSKEENTSR